MSAVPKPIPALACASQAVLTTHGPGAVTAGAPQLPFKSGRAQETPNRDADLYEWFLHEANELRSRKPEFIDWGELAEELDEIVALARSEVVSRCSQILAHLLKWEFQTTSRDENSWKSTIIRERVRLGDLLRSRNLRNYMDKEGFAKAYQDARKIAGTDMQLERYVWNRTFPDTCKWTLNETLDDDFFPSIASDSNGHSR
jgi:hypothetical protein